MPFSMEFFSILSLLAYLCYTCYNHIGDNMDKERKSNFELLKILSILLIITFHFFWHSGFTPENGTLLKKITDFISMFGELGVNCFGLITGYFCINKKFKIKNVIKIFVQVLFYSMSIYLVSKFIFNIETPLYISLFALPLGVWWYITAYTLVYLISPYLNKIINYSKRKKNFQMVMLLIILFSIIPTIFGILYNNTEYLFYYNRFIWLIIIYIIGAYIQKYNIFLFSNLKKCIINLLFSVTLIIISIIAIEKIAFLNNSINTNYFWQPNSILMLYLSVSLFMVFKFIKIKNIPIINKLASTTLGVYMLHDGISGQIWWNNIFNPRDIFYNFNTSFYKMLLIILIIFIVCSIIDLLRQIIFKYTIDKLIDRINLKKLSKNKFIKKLNNYLKE